MFLRFCSKSEALASDLQQSLEDMFTGLLLFTLFICYCTNVMLFLVLIRTYYKYHSGNMSLRPLYDGEHTIDKYMVCSTTSIKDLLVFLKLKLQKYWKIFRINIFLLLVVVISESCSSD